MHKLDDTKKVIKAGNAKKPFYQTEKKAYEYLSRRIMQMRIAQEYDVETIMVRKRMQFLYNLPSKYEVVSKLIRKLEDENKRIVIFGQSTQALDKLTKYAVHSNKHKKENDKIYSDFNDEIINQIASAKKIKEGVNLTKVDSLIIDSFDSSLLNIIQRVGRVVRFREGHIADIYIIVTSDTQEEKWIESLENAGFDLRNPTYLPSNRL
jgi:superfamily II DNA or RNA helicase